ncbi:MAG TPA: PilZ domain-containing protein [Candidatus Competibacteraceae bacterium]|nr:PilZ domain-containing protein [Candidatus Competibacteraceae bacterium]HQA25934.1 PilZ domain-containing protein [Candidatus Competibacteraceae bacterium]HQD56231.1 PilZ domain-containing protein [Candidatus Competibacteraceae bacterium]
MNFAGHIGVENRKHKRWYLMMYLRVYRQDNKELLGHIVDISREGMRLVSDKPITLNQTFQLWVDVPKENAARQHIALEVESLWSGRDVNPDFYDTGFRIKNINTQALLQLKLLIDELQF